MTDSAREALLVVNRVAELVETPVRGRFDLDHLRAIHAHIFQDLPQHRPGQVRSDTSGWSKTRALEGEPGVHDVHYAHEDIAGRITRTLHQLGGPAALAGLPPADAAKRLAGLYGDLDHAHAFHEGNSRTLREFTRSLAQAAGFDLNWAPTGANAEQRNRLYIARDIAVLERAYPGLTPERGMETSDRYEYEASLALPALRRRGPTLEAIIGEGLTALPAPRQEAAAGASTTSRSVIDRTLDALARSARQASLPPDAQHTPIADRMRSRAEPPAAAPAAPNATPDRKPSPGYRSDTSPGF